MWSPLLQPTSVVCPQPTGGMVYILENWRVSSFYFSIPKFILALASIPGRYSLSCCTCCYTSCCISCCISCYTICLHGRYRTDCTLWDAPAASPSAGCGPCLRHGCAKFLPPRSLSSSRRKLSSGKRTTEPNGRHWWHQPREGPTEGLEKPEPRSSAAW